MLDCALVMRDVRAKWIPGEIDAGPVAVSA
jgi:hypothetical protein